MKKFLLIAAITLAVPMAARADVGVRLGVDAQLAYHDPGGGGSTHFITDNWPVGGELMLSWWSPLQIFSIDLEIAEQLYLNTPNCPAGISCGSRIGTVFRPGVRFQPPVLPIYLRAAVPINFEQPDPYKRETVDLRLGAGIRIPVIGIFVEGDVDTPIAGGTNPPSAFSEWSFDLTAGVDWRF